MFVPSDGVGGKRHFGTWSRLCLGLDWIGEKSMLFQEGCEHRQNGLVVGSVSEATKGVVRNWARPGPNAEIGARISTKQDHFPEIRRILTHVTNACLCIYNVSLQSWLIGVCTGARAAA